MQLSAAEIVNAIEETPKANKSIWRPLEWSFGYLARETEPCDAMARKVFYGPIRNIVWISELKAGMWVRNGPKINDLCWFYGSSRLLRREAMYQDLQCILYSLASINPEEWAHMTAGEFGVFHLLTGDETVTPLVRESPEAESAMLISLFMLMIFCMQNPYPDSMSQYDYVRSSVIHSLGMYSVKATSQA